MSQTDEPSDNQLPQKNTQKTTRQHKRSTTVETFESPVADNNHELPEIDQKRYSAADRWKALLKMAVVLIVGGALLIGGGVLFAQHQRSQQEKRDRGAGERATQQLKYAATVARSIAQTRNGNFVIQSSVNNYRQLAQQIEKKDSRIGFASLLPQGKIQGGGVYIDAKKSTLTTLRLSTLIDVSGESNDLVFSITVKNPDKKNLVKK